MNTSNLYYIYTTLFAREKNGFTCPEEYRCPVLEIRGFSHYQTRRGLWRPRSLKRAEALPQFPFRGSYGRPFYRLERTTWDPPCPVVTKKHFVEVWPKFCFSAETLSCVVNVLVEKDAHQRMNLRRNLRDWIAMLRSPRGLVCHRILESCDDG